MNDAQRWILAERLANGDVDPEWQRRRRRWVIGLVVALILLVTVGFAVTVVLARNGHHRTTHHADPPIWRSVMGLVVILFGCIVECLALRRLHRNGQFRQIWNGPLTALSFRQRRLVMRQIRGKAPVDDRHLTVLRGTAVVMQRLQTLTLASLAGLILVLTGGAIQNFSWVSAAYLAVMIVVLTPTAFVTGRRNARAAKTFLRTHPEPVP